MAIGRTSASRSRRRCARSTGPGRANADPAEAALDAARRRRAPGNASRAHPRARSSQLEAALRRGVTADVVVERHAASTRGSSTSSPRIAGASAGLMVGAPSGARRRRLLRGQAARASPTRSSAYLRGAPSAGGARPVAARRARASGRRSRRSTPAPPSSRPTRPTTTPPTRTRTRSSPRDATAVVILGQRARTGSARGSSSTTAACTPSMALRERRLRDHHGQLQPRDGLDRLRHLGPPLLRAAHLEDVANVLDAEPAGRRTEPGVIVQFGRPDARSSSPPARAAGAASSARRPRPSTWPRTASAGTRCCDELGIPSPPAARATTVDEALAVAARSATRCWCARATCSAGGPWRSSTTTSDLRRRDVDRGPSTRGRRLGRSPGPRRPVPGGRDRGGRRRRARTAGEVLDRPASWSTSRRPASTRATRRARCHRRPRRRRWSTRSSGTPGPSPALEVVRPPQRPVRRQGRAALRARGQPAGQPHGAVRGQGHRRAAGQGGRPGHGRADPGASSPRACSAAGRRAGLT